MAIDVGSHLRKDLRIVLSDVRGATLAVLLPVVILATYARLSLADLAASGRDPNAFILVLSVSFPILLVSSTAIVIERRMGTLQRLTRSPANLAAVVVSKLITGSLAVLVSSLLAVAMAALLVPGAHVQDHLAQSLAILWCAGVAALALGIAVSSIVRSEAQALQLTAMAFLVMFTLSGFLQPLSGLGFLGKLGSVTPIALGYQGLQAGLGPESNGTGYVFPLLAFAFCLTAVAIAATIASRTKPVQ